ncbi:flavodoxin family protein [Variovorax sp. JS1663]|uniref:flavodoxin family protein n=1 Tax=Variovorax sp. JS1663 TaxID=1851577 RepID=UPI000B346FE3|nr:flavodoxin [Variovorax sp. JS1663]OUM00925.1 flavodoxin [Variovorax sp. JS1663]
MSKVLVVVYSYTSTARRAAQLLSQQQGWELAEIEEARPRSGVLGILRCILDSIFRRCPEIRYDGPLPRKFDAVVLVSPIWAGRLAGPMRTFVTHRRDHLPEVAVVSVMGGRGAPNAVAEIGRIIGRAPFLSAAFTAREVDDGSFAGRLRAFGSAVAGVKDSSAVVRPVALSPQVA